MTIIIGTACFVLGFFFAKLTNGRGTGTAHREPRRRTKITK